MCVADGGRSPDTSRPAPAWIDHSDLPRRLIREDGSSSRADRAADLPCLLELGVGQDRLRHRVSPRRRWPARRRPWAGSSRRRYPTCRSACCRKACTPSTQTRFSGTSWNNRGDMRRRTRVEHAEREPGSSVLPAPQAEHQVGLLDAAGDQRGPHTRLAVCGLRSAGRAGWGRGSSGCPGPDRTPRRPARPFVVQVARPATTRCSGCTWPEVLRKKI